MQEAKRNTPLAASDAAAVFVRLSAQEREAILELMRLMVAHGNEVRRMDVNKPTAEQKARLEESINRVLKLPPQEQDMIITMWGRFVEDLAAETKRPGV